MSINKNIITYYKARAKEYEKIYAKPERQGQLLQASEILQQIFSGKNVLEIACGTGYWTERISQTASSILATDINESVIEIAKTKKYNCPVNFQIVDIYKPAGLTGYESIFGGFIWSHIPLQDLEKFIDNINAQTIPGGTIVLIDNNYVEGSSLPVTETDKFGNTYQTRKLEDGSEHLVLKNFPTREFLKDLLHNKATDIEFIDLKYYWIMKYCPSGA